MSRNLPEKLNLIEIAFLSDLLKEELLQARPELRLANHEERTFDISKLKKRMRLLKRILEVLDIQAKMIRAASFEKEKMSNKWTRGIIHNK